MRKEIKYIGFYDLPSAKCSRVSALAAINKMDYIAHAINEAGYDVHIVSPSWSSNNGLIPTAYRGDTIKIDSNKRITFCPTFLKNNKFINYFKIAYSLIWLCVWLIKNVKRKEKILVYHVQWLSLPIRLAKRLKGFQLILEVEEFYNKIWENNNILKRWEEKLIKSADSYIAVSDVLADILGSKVEAILYGSYTLPEINVSKVSSINRIINVVYAGSIEDIKGGAYKAVKCAALLPDNYIVHILGGGQEQSKKKLLDQIDIINNKLKRRGCIYHGVLIGQDYNNFLSSCQIALNPQKEGDYMNTAFPSKVISYLSHNLRVVSTRIKSIELSKINTLIDFSEDDQVINITKKILTIDLNAPCNSSIEIQKLNNEFVLELKNIFGEN